MPTFLSCSVEKIMYKLIKQEFSDEDIDAMRKEYN